MPKTLPPELWHRVFTYLDPESLSTVCQVSSTFHRLATADTLFRQHLAPHLQGNHAAQIYRRFEALHYPTTTHISVHSSTRTEPFAIVGDRLLLCDFERSRIVTFPDGQVIPSDANSLPWGYLTFPDERRSSVVLPENHVGFMYDRSRTRFAVMNVETADLWTYPVLGDRFPDRHIRYGEPFLPAGNGAEWIAYLVNDTRLVLVDWRSGEVDREIEVSKDVRYVMAECPGIDANSLVGLVYVKERGLEKEVVVKSFDGDYDIFPLDRDMTLVMVLRSADKKTHALITSSGPENDEKKYFQVSRRGKGKPVCWGGELSMLGYPEMRDNGRVLACRCGAHSRELSFVSSHKHLSQLWIDIGGASSSKAVLVPDNMILGTLVWTRHTKDGGFAVFTEDERSIVLAKFWFDGSSFNHVRLRAWIVNNMISVYVVADHYIVVQKRDGKIIVFHFDRFCEGATGVYACPGFVEEEHDEFSEHSMDMMW